MSTADGAILAMGTVLSNNILRHFKCRCVTHDTLLRAARLATIPFGVLAAIIASMRPGQTGYLLIVAFDITLAAAVVPLFGCFYTKNPRPAAAFASVLTGIITRIILEFTLPKVRQLVVIHGRVYVCMCVALYDLYVRSNTHSLYSSRCCDSQDGFLLLPYGGDEFLNYGPAASAKVRSLRFHIVIMIVGTSFHSLHSQNASYAQSFYSYAKAPLFVDAPADEVWNPEEEPCDQERFADFTGADSLGAAFASLCVFAFFQFLERNKPAEESWLCKNRYFRPYKPKEKKEEEAEEDEEDTVPDFGWLHKLSMTGHSLTTSMRASIIRSSDKGTLSSTGKDTLSSSGKGMSEDLDAVKEADDAVKEAGAGVDSNFQEEE